MVTNKSPTPFTVTFINLCHTTYSNLPLLPKSASSFYPLLQKKPLAFWQCLCCNVKFTIRHYEIKTSLRGLLLVFNIWWQRWKDLFNSVITMALLFAFGSEFSGLVRGNVIIQGFEFRMPMKFAQFVISGHVVPLQISVTQHESEFGMPKLVQFLP